MELSQNSNQKSILTNKWKYRKIVVKNQVQQEMELSQNINQKSNVTK